MSVVIFLNYCTNLNDNPTQPVDQPASEGSVTLNLDMSAAPQNVASVKGFLARAEEDTVFFTFEIRGDKAVAQVENVMSGDWYLQVDACDAQGNVLYTGNTQVTVEAGKIIPVYLQLNPVTGGLIIYVSWGEVTEQKFLMMALTPENVWHILGLDINTKKIIDFGEGRYPFVINRDPKRAEFYFLQGNDLLCKYNIIRHEITPIANLNVNANFLFYSKPLNRILFNYKQFGDPKNDWNLGSVDLSGNDFHTIIADSFYEKYPVTPSNEDWIYYHTNRAGNEAIFRIKHDGNLNEPFLTEANYHDEFLAFSFDGHKYVYTRMSLDSTYMSIVVKDRAGQIKEIDVSEIGEPTYPAFTPDGQHVVVSLIVGPTHKDRQLFVWDLNSNNLEQITFGHTYYWYARPIFW